MADHLDARLAAGEIVVIDGGMGTELEARGVPMVHGAWCAAANLEHKDVVREIHADFIRAGAEVLLTNTYPTARFALELSGLQDETEAINRRAVEAAIEARDEAAEGPVYIAGSISSFGYESRPDLTQEDLRPAFVEQAALLVEGGVDLLVLEMADPDWAVGLDVALETGLPIWLSPIVDRRESDGVIGPRWHPERSVSGSLEEMVTSMQSPQITAITVMHSSVDVTVDALDALKPVWDKPYGAYPHWGTFERPNWTFSDISPEEFATAAQAWIASGAQLVGGCCGIRPEHIRALRDRVPVGTRLDGRPTSA